MQTGDEHWHSRVKPPVRLDAASCTDWDDEADVIIIGLGGAGVCAAIEALQAGAKVIAIDRFDGGGATRLSGGVFYSGGGTPYQAEAGVHDTAEEMYKYLKREVADAVPEETLRDFCERSRENLEWLSQHGVRFNSSLSPVKTSYPAKGYFLYHSGNEAVADYAEHARPAPRGHRAYGRGLTGACFYDPLLRSALSLGLKLYRFSEARRVILSECGEIAGVEFQHVEENTSGARSLARASARFSDAATLLFPGIAKSLIAKANAVSDASGRTRKVRARRAVVLTAGGFVHNRDMLSHHAPGFSGAIALGSIGCDGTGIRLGQSVGAGTARMSNVSAWRLFNPPSSFARGIVVNADGERFVSEDSYGARIGHLIAEHCSGKARIILDRRLRDEALLESLPTPGKLFRLQGAPALMALFLCTKKASSIESLARKCGMKPDILSAEVAHYNRCSEGLEIPKFRKQAAFVGRIDSPPFYAVDISIDNRCYLCPTITLGGLAVNTATGQVVDTDDKPIPRLYAAGKTAVGVSSNHYVSGLALADCVYSGRIAGRSAAL